MPFLFKHISVPLAIAAKKKFNFLKNFFRKSVFENIIYFFPIRVTTTIISTMIAITIKIPKPIPALKIPPINAQELNSEDRINSKKIDKEFILFIINYCMFIETN